MCLIWITIPLMVFMFCAVAFVIGMALTCYSETMKPPSEKNHV